MGLDERGVSGLREDFDKILVGQEVEAGERGALCVQVADELLEDLVEPRVVLLEQRQQPLLGAARRNVADL